MSRALHMADKLLARYPWAKAPAIICAPMRVMGGPELAVAVTQAGGLGFIGPGVKTEATNDNLDKAASLLSSTNSIPRTSAKELPVGVGFQLWTDDLDVAEVGIRKHAPCAAWLFAPRDPEQDYKQWTSRIRRASPTTQIWLQIGTVREALSLIQQDAETKPDVVVIQGAEAGGHGRAHDGLGLLSLFPEVADTLRETDIPVVAAGGIADGRGAAAALSLGAAGVVMGTRFLASTEARIAKGYQAEVVRANDAASSTTRTQLYNHLRGTYGWPDPYAPRTIVNKSWYEHEAGVPFEELKRRHDEMAKTSKDDSSVGWGPDGRLATYAGASIGLIHDVQDAATLVRDVRESCKEILSRNSAHYSDSESKL